MDKRNFTNKWIKERLGAQPSSWDPKSADYALRSATLKDFEDLPIEFNLLDYAPDNFPNDQGNIGTCVGWGYSGVAETQATIMALSLSLPKILKLATTNLSAGWVYHFSRKHSVPPVPDHIEGSTNFGACRALHKIGAVLEADAPTDIRAPWDGVIVTDELLVKALTYKITSYHNVPSDPITVKAAIYGLLHMMPYAMPDGAPGKTPLASAYPVYKSFRDAYNDGIVPMPGVNDTLLGGHSSMIIGWKIIDGKEYFVNFNSWGTDVGDNGLFYIPVEYPFYPNDWWLIMLIPGLDPPDVTCLVEQPSWIVNLLNNFTSTSKYFYGLKVHGR